MLPACSKRTEPPLVVTRTEYVFPPEEYLAPTHEPSIAGYPRTNGGLAKAYLDTKRALRDANSDKAAIRAYLTRIRKEASFGGKSGNLLE